MSGAEDGRVRVFEDKSKNLMKQFRCRFSSFVAAVLLTFKRGHSGPVRLSRFCPDKISVMSGGDDGTVRRWDLATEEQLFSVSFHSDSVRCGFVSEASPSVWLTGAYDKRVIALDTRTGQVSFQIDTEEGVEAMTSGLFSRIASLSDGVQVSGDSSIAVACGSAVKLYDMRAVDKGAFVTLANHSKTVTCLDFNRTRLLSGSADHTVKVKAVVMRLIF